MRKNLKSQICILLITVSSLALFAFSTTETVTASPYQFQAEDLLSRLDFIINVTATIDTKAWHEKINLPNARVALVTSDTLTPLLVTENLIDGKDWMLQPAYINLDHYYKYIKGIEPLDTRALFRPTGFSRTNNDSGDTGGYNTIATDTFSAETLFRKADTRLSFNGSDILSDIVLESDYQDFYTKITRNASENDYLTTANYQATRDYRCLISGFSSLETEFLETVTSNIAVNQSTTADNVHITWYNVTSANTTHYVTEALSSGVRAAIASAQTTVAVNFFGITFMTAKASLNTDLVDTVGQVINFGEFFVSQDLPRITDSVATSLGIDLTSVLSIVQAILAGVLSLPSTISKAVSTIGSTLGTALSTAVSKIQQYVGQVTTSAFNTLTSAIAEGSNTLYNMLNKSVGTIIGQAISPITQVLSILPFLALGLVLGLALVVLFYWYFFMRD